MAFDFPSSPTNGDVFISAGVSYTWNGYAWIGGQTGAGPDAPSDGGEYTRVNGIWRLKSQSIPLDGKNTQELIVPAGAKMMLLRGAIYPATAAMTSVAAQVSIDGTNWLSTATSYHYGGLVHYTGTLGYSTIPASNSSFLYLAINQDQANVPLMFDARCQTVRYANGAGDPWMNFITSAGLSAPATTQMMHTVHRAYVMGIAAGPLDIKKYLFFLAAGQNFGTSSVLNAEWIY